MAATGSKTLSILAMAAIAVSFLSSVVVAQESPAPAPVMGGAMAGAMVSPLTAGVLTSAVVLLLGSLRQ